MLTNNFKNMLFILGGDNTAIDVNGTEQTMYGIISDSVYSSTYDIDYANTESTGFFTKEISPSINPNTETYASANSGTLRNAFYIYNSPYQKNTLGMLVGTGNTVASVTDYKLANQVELTSGVDSANMDANTEVIKLVREFINNTEASVTINEVGIYIVSCRKTASNANTTNVFLIAREVLEEPIEIAVGKSCTFTYYIDMSGIV